MCGSSMTQVAAPVQSTDIHWIAGIKSLKINRMKISREDVATKLRAYLCHELPLTDVVD